MTDRLTEIDLDALQAAIESDIRAAFPSLVNVEFYGETRSGMALPACLLELCEFEDSAEHDPGTEQLAVTARFEARFIILGVQTKASKKSVRKLVAAFSAWLRLRRWTDVAHAGKKLPTGPAQFLSAEPDPFHPEADQYECWRVEWQQVLHLGTSVWKPDPGATVPTEVNSAFAPDNGAGGTYTEVT